MPQVYTLSMETLDVIDIIRRANFSSKDYRVKIDRGVTSRGLLEAWSIQVYIGHLARLGMGTQVLDVAYTINLHDGELTLNYIFREGNWIKVLERDAEREDAARLASKAKLEEENVRRMSPINDKSLFLEKF